MKKGSTANKTPRALRKKEKKQLCQLATQQRLTIGLDLGDQFSRYCILADEQVVSQGQLSTTAAGLSSLFAQMPRSRVALEVGTHSPWVSRLIGSQGHEVIVANPHQVKLITQSLRKSDRIDAEKLARLARVDPKLLSPIRHRGEEAQADLAVIRARGQLIAVRTDLINSARGLVKPRGERLKKCDADQVGEEMCRGLSAASQEVVEGLLRIVAAMTAEIQAYDRKIEAIAQRYPEVRLLKQVWGVGPLVSLAFVLTIEDVDRFPHSRDVGPFLGLQPRQRDSGNSQPQLGITKSGDRMMRSLLVQAAHCILRKGAPDSDLREWGQSKMQVGGKKGKRRAVVAVARKLAVLLHRLWATGEVYDPRYNRGPATAGEKAA